jgi:F0F1-type ATP synthase epsilon subunit
MLLTINSPEQQLRKGAIQKVTLPTEIGEITILPGHQPLISVIKSGMVRLVPQEMPSPEQGYTLVDGHVMIAVAKGLVAVTEQEIIVTTSVGTSGTQETTEVLEKMHADMVVKIAQIKTDGNEEDLEDAIMHMEKITANLRIAKIGNVR